MSLAFSQSTADVLVPDGLDPASALARTTHLGIGAHQDDLEFMAYAGIAECFGRPDAWFAGVTCTSGAGSSRSGPYARHTDEQMRTLRREEQRAAARAGRYAAMLQLDFASAELQTPAGLAALTADLRTLLATMRPRVIYTHNPADKHNTHTAVFRAVLAAVRAWSAEPGVAGRAASPQFLGCEVWRGLDWLPDEEKVLLDCSPRPELADQLFGCYASQIAGGKRYDLAVRGRWAANATLLAPRAGDTSSAIAYAMDLAPLRKDPSLDPAAFVEGKLRGLATEVHRQLS